MVILLILLYETSRCRGNRTHYMKNLINKAKKTSIDVACAGLGSIHFIGQSIADAASELEARIKLKETGLDKEQCKTERMIKTITLQYKIRERFNRKQRAEEVSLLTLTNVITH